MGEACGDGKPAAADGDGVRNGSSGQAGRRPKPDVAGGCGKAPTSGHSPSPSDSTVRGSNRGRAPTARLLESMSNATGSSSRVAAPSFGDASGALHSMGRAHHTASTQALPVASASLTVALTAAKAAAAAPKAGAVDFAAGPSEPAPDPTKPYVRGCQASGNRRRAGDCPRSAGGSRRSAGGCRHRACGRRRQTYGCRREACGRRRQSRGSSRRACSHQAANSRR